MQLTDRLHIDKPQPTDPAPVERASAVSKAPGVLRQRKQVRTCGAAAEKKILGADRLGGRQLHSRTAAEAKVKGATPGKSIAGRRLRVEGFDGRVELAIYNQKTQPIYPPKNANVKSFQVERPRNPPHPPGPHAANRNTRVRIRVVTPAGVLGK